MVKVNAPMLSLDASGSIAGALVFSKWKGRPYARVLVKPANPRTGGQVGLRSYFKFLSQKWAALDLSTQNTWLTIADQIVASTFNAYMQFNMKLARNFLAPTQDAAYAQSETPSNVDTFTATAGERQITIAINDDQVDDTPWGFIIFRSTSTGFTPAFDNAVALILGQGATVVNFVDTPLVPDTYYYDAKSFAIDGTYSSLSGEINATVA